MGAVGATSCNQRHRAVDQSGSSSVTALWPKGFRSQDRLTGVVVGDVSGAFYWFGRIHRVQPRRRGVIDLFGTALEDLTAVRFLPGGSYPRRRRSIIRRMCSADTREDPADDECQKRDVDYRAFFDHALISRNFDIAVLREAGDRQILEGRECGAVFQPYRRTMAAGRRRDPAAMGHARSAACAAEARVARRKGEMYALERQTSGCGHPEKQSPAGLTFRLARTSHQRERRGHLVDRDAVKYPPRAATRSTRSRANQLLRKTTVRRPHRAPSRATERVLRR